MVKWLGNIIRNARNIISQKSEVVKPENSFLAVKSAFKNHRKSNLFNFAGIFGLVCVYSQTSGSDLKISHAWTFPFVYENNVEPLEANKKTEKTLKEAIEYSDRKDKEVEQSYNDLIKFEKDAATNLELAWRLSRACLEMASIMETTAEETKEFHSKALEYASVAVRINPWSSVAHLWMGTALSYNNVHEYFLQRIFNATIIKGHFERAIDLNPMDPLTHHMLGMWHFTVADYSFFSQVLSVAIYGGSVISTSFQQALMKFEDAERIKPNFSVKNHLMIAKSNVRIGNYAAARKWLDHILKMKKSCKEDEQIKEEAMFIIEYLDHIEK